MELVSTIHHIDDFKGNAVAVEEVNLGQRVICTLLPCDVMKHALQGRATLVKSYATRIRTFQDKLRLMTSVTCFRTWTGDDRGVKMHDGSRRCLCLEIRTGNLRYGFIR